MSLRKIICKLIYFDLGYLAVFLACAVFFGLGQPSPVLAENRALILGVGDYELERANLDGIDLDVAMMREMATLLGFSDNQIEVFMNSEVNSRTIESRISNWLIQGTGPGDMVLFYFSGHGSQQPDANGDEQDGSDEVLCLHDLGIVQKNGKKMLKGVYPDDKFFKQLRELAGRDVYVILDCCHSGTATKGLSLEPRSIPISQAQVKFFYYPGMPKSAWKKGAFASKAVSDFRAKGENLSYLALSSCRDDEKSLATSQGSIFTLALRQTMKSAYSKGASVTPVQLQEKAQIFVSEQLPASKQFHPQVSGDSELKNKGLRLAGSTGGQNEVWQKLEGLVQKSSQQIKIRLNQSNFRLGDHMRMQVEIPYSGYLNVVNVGAKGKGTVLFPNQFHKQNRMQAGTLNLPTSKMDFDLVASRPVGPSLLVALLTSRPINLYKEGFKDSMDVFAELSPKGMRSFKVQKREEKMAAGKMETEVRE